jgi:hypothetical protein
MKLKKSFHFIVSCQLGHWKPTPLLCFGGIGRPLEIGRPLVVIMAVLRIHNCGSIEVKELVLIYNHGSNKSGINQIIAHQTAGSFMKTIGSLIFFSNNWDWWFSDSDLF